MNEKLANEMVAELKGAKTAEELIAIVKAYGGEVTEEQMKAFSGRAQGELSDDALESAAGGKVDWAYVGEQIKKYGPSVAPALYTVYF